MHIGRLTVFLLLSLPAVFCGMAQAQTQQVSPNAYSISGWRVECSSQSNALACQLIDQVTARANNGVIAGISVVQAGTAKTPTLIVQVPLGAALDQSVRVGFNGGAEQMLPFVSCYNNGCFARAGLQDSLLAQMRDGKQPLSVSYSTYDANMNKQSIRITLPLDGFAVAYDKLK
jgi:invasion protein IalB